MDSGIVELDSEENGEEELFGGDEDLGQEEEDLFGDDEDLGQEEEDLFGDDEDLGMEDQDPDDGLGYEQADIGGESHDAEEFVVEGDQNSDDLYGDKSRVNQKTADILSRARFTLVNLEILNRFQPTIRALPEEQIFEIIMSSLGNSKINETFTTNSIQEKYSLLLSEQNLNEEDAVPRVIFKPELFNRMIVDNTDGHEDEQDLNTFIASIKTASKHEESKSYKCLTVNRTWAHPNYLFSKEASDAIKKLFSIELLSDELSSRIEIQKTLSDRIFEYEELLLGCYESIAYLKSSGTQTKEENTLHKKIGYMHFAIDKEGYESILFRKMRTHKDFIERDEILKIKKQTLSTPPKQKIKVVAPTKKQSLFKTVNTEGFNIASYSKLDIENKISDIRKFLDRKPKPSAF